MKKLLITAIIILLIILTGITMIKGINVGKLSVLGIKDIKKEDEQKIFERFYKIDESRNRNENRYGLGLAIAKDIVEKHNAKISASSKKGITTFKVTF